MPVPSSILDLDTSEAMNSPAGSDPVGGTLDNYLRAHAAILKRQFVKGNDLNSAATLNVPAEGSYFLVKNLVTPITEFADNFAGRVVALRFEAGITLEHSSALILPGGLDIVTREDDTATFINESSGVWRCLHYSRADYSKWMSRAIGEVFAIQTDLTGAEIPPNTSPDFRYIVLTASDSYNDGALTDESVSGSAPEITATAVIDYPASPMHGQTVRLINTERRFLRAGSAGTTETSANKSHTHTGTATSAGAHTHAASTGSAGAHTHNYQRATGANSYGSGGVAAFADNTLTATSSAGAHTHTVTVNSAGAHTHPLSVDADGEAEARPYNVGITYFMRIA
jgi:hypothetical protein